MSSGSSPVRTARAGRRAWAGGTPARSPRHPQIERLAGLLKGTVVDGGGFKGRGLLFQALENLWRQQIRQDQIAFYFNLPNALPRGERGPISCVDSWCTHSARNRAHKISIVCESPL